jgi:hypothetical protein
MVQQLDDDTWFVETAQKIPGGAKLPARMYILRLPDGALWIHSPVAMDDALAAEIDALGPVRHLVAPNCYHHLHMGPAAARWPDARVYAPAGLRRKRPDLRIDVDLSDGARPWGDAVEIVKIEGVPELDEFVFVHHPSKSLVACDLVFNIHDDPRLMTRLILRMVGVWKRLGQSKLVRSVTEDRAAAARSCERVLGLEFSRVLVSHGRPEQGEDVRERLRDGLAWMLAGA